MRAGTEVKAALEKITGAPDGTQKSASTTSKVNWKGDPTDYAVGATQKAIGFILATGSQGEDAYSFSGITMTMGSSAASFAPGTSGFAFDTYYTANSVIIDFTIAAAEGLTVEWSTDGNAWTAGRTGSAVAGDILIRLTNADGVKKTVTKTLAADGDELDASDATFGWPEYLGEAIDSDTYGIDNADELVLFQKGVAANLATAGITFRQTADIDMTGVSAFAGIAAYDENGKGATVFEGTYDGSGKTISNVQLKAAAYTALFNQVSGTVKNLTVQNVSYAEGATFGGAMVVCNLVGGTVENVTTKGAFGTAERPLTHCAAGVVCRAGAGVIRACTNQAAVVGSYTKVAGILAVQQSKTGVVDADGNAALLVESCSNEGSVTAMSGADAGRDGIGGIFAYPMNDNAVTIKDCANTGAVVAGENCSTSAKAGQIVGYYYTDVAFDGVNKGTTDALMIGAYNNNDSGYNFATVDGTVATLVADSDMVAGGSYMVVAAGGKPVIELAKEESISFDTSLADIDATGITAVDGCRIEAIAEGLSITYTALVPGSEKLPWKIGPEGYEAEVVAWTNGMGTLVINGTGAVKSTPWDENSAGITRLQVAEDVTALDGTIETLPDLRFVNGLSLGAFNSAAVGAVKAAGFNAIAVENGKVTLTLVVKTAATVNAEEKDWTEAATKDVEVDASAPAGFFIVVPQTK